MYYTVHDWMISELGLQGAALLCYAVIYSYSREGLGTYYGSNADMCAATGLTERTVRGVLRDLEDRGLLVRSEGFHQGTRCFDYVAVTEGAKIAGGKNCRGQNLPGEGAKNAPMRGQNLPSFPPTPPYPEDNKYNKTRIANNGRARARKEIKLPYASEAFASQWAVLCQQPKWRGKSDQALQASADKLGQVPEAEAVAMMVNAIAGGWQGLFPLKAEERRALRQAGALQPEWTDLAAMPGDDAAEEGRAI